MPTAGVPYRATLDGNEQYRDVGSVAALLEAMRGAPALTRQYDSILFVEQPIERSFALETDVSGAAIGKPVEIDEADGTLDAFPRALGSLACTGFASAVEPDRSAMRPMPYPD